MEGERDIAELVVVSGLDETISTAATAETTAVIPEYIRFLPLIGR
jgi:hypothetical protein